MIELLQGDNKELMKDLLSRGVKVQAVYADCIYEDKNFVKELYNWVDFCWQLLDDNGIFYVQTDYHTSAWYKLYCDYRFGENNFIAWLIYKQEWGGVPKKGFPIKHDDILMYSKGKDWKWYGDRIQIPKVTAGTKLDPRGKGTKTPCSVFDDLGNFSTISKERVKLGNKNVQWQKPLKLMDRLLLPVTDEGDVVLDCFMGSGTTGVWCKKTNRSFIGIENDPEIFQLAKDRIENSNK